MKKTEFFLHKIAVLLWLRKLDLNPQDSAILLSSVAMTELSTLVSVIQNILCDVSLFAKWVSNLVISAALRVAP